MSLITALKSEAVKQYTLEAHWHDSYLFWKQTELIKKIYFLKDFFCILFNKFNFLLLE